MPRAFDAKPGNIAVPQLVHLHARLTAKLATSLETSNRTAADIGHIEAVIRLFDPAYDVRRIPGRRRNVGNPWFKRGTMFRAALDVLRKANAPMTTMQMAKRVIAAKGGREPTRDQLRKMDAAIRSCIAKNAGKSVRRVGEVTPARWRLWDIHNQK
jgi:hypothetical protein